MRRLARLFTGLLAVFVLSACDAADAPQQDWPAPSPALWQITAPDGAQGWLFGTVHALPDGVRWRTAALEEALAASGVLIVEIADLDPPAGERHFRALATSPGQPPLLSRVPPADQPALADLMARAGHAPGDFAQLETWAAALMLGNAVRAGDPANGVDRALIAGADQVEGLESLGRQFRLFDTLPTAQQSDLLAAVARESARPNQNEALLAWLTGSLDALHALGRQEGGILADPELYEALLAARNRRWLPAIARALDDGRAPFVAVGALHLPGEDGLVALLERQGYTLARIQ